MNKRDNQKVHMYNAVLNTCRNQEAVWSGIPKFVNTIAELESRLSVLLQTQTEQMLKTAGVTGITKELKSELAERMIVIHKALVVHGSEIHDNVLVARNKISLSVLKGLSANKLLSRIEAMSHDVQIHGPALSEYGITPEYINETQLLMASTSNALFQPRFAIVSRHGLTESIKDQIRIIDKLLSGTLDSLIFSFKLSLPVFYTNYRSARMIIGSGNTPKEPDDGKTEL